MKWEFSPCFSLSFLVPAALRRTTLIQSRRPACAEELGFSVRSPVLPPELHEFHVSVLCLMFLLIYGVSVDEFSVLNHQECLHFVKEASRIRDADGSSSIRVNICSCGAESRSRRRRFRSRNVWTDEHDPQCQPKPSPHTAVLHSWRWIFCSAHINTEARNGTLGTGNFGCLPEFSSFTCQSSWEFLVHFSAVTQTQNSSESPEFWSGFSLDESGEGVFLHPASPGICSLMSKSAAARQAWCGIQQPAQVGVRRAWVGYPSPTSMKFVDLKETTQPHFHT